jgi:hypothetical protein
MKKFVLSNLTTGQPLRKTQATTPNVKGYTVVSVETVLPETNAAGQRLFIDANNCPYYADVDADGSHRQP